MIGSAWAEIGEWTLSFIAVVAQKIVPFAPKTIGP